MAMGVDTSRDPVCGMDIEVLGPLSLPSIEAWPSTISI